MTAKSCPDAVFMVQRSGALEMWGHGQEGLGEGRGGASRDDPGNNQHILNTPFIGRR